MTALRSVLKVKIQRKETLLILGQNYECAFHNNNLMIGKTKEVPTIYYAAVKCFSVLKLKSPLTRAVR